MTECLEPEVRTVRKRMWIRSGIVEQLDQRQVKLLELVYSKIDLYYRDLYQKRPCYKYPLSLWRLAKLCRRSGSTIASAIKYLANTVPVGSTTRPAIYYDRISSERNPSHRPYRIFIRKSDKQ